MVRAPPIAAIPEQFRAVSILQSCADTAVPLIADRFLADDDGVVDLATGESIRLSIDAARSCGRARVALCDRLFALRHPLLLPLVDYGAFGDHWFEAHAHLAPLRVPRMQASAAALHLVRFLRASAIELDAAAASRHVRAAVDGEGRRWRPVGLTLQPRPPLEAIRTVLEAHGRPGVTAIVVHAAHGSGLRTARWQLARLARQAGYLVIDARFGALEDALALPRHLCVFDWLPDAATLPTVLAFAEMRGARRHAWIRFCRHPVPGAGSIGLEPFMTRDLINAIYLDAQLGPTAGEVRCAVASCAGNAGTLIEVLSAGKGGRSQPCWVHETAPEYRARPIPAPTPTRLPDAGVARLARAADAAAALAARGRHVRAGRVLARCVPALAARGAFEAAAAAALALGELCLRRGRVDGALAAFEDARRWNPDASVTVRAWLGAGEALLERGSLAEAEGALRSAIVTGVEPQASSSRRLLAELLVLTGRLDAAEEALAPEHPDPVIMATIRRMHGDIATAARLIAHALAGVSKDADPARACEAHLEAARVHAALGDLDAVRRHGREARRAARRAHRSILGLRAAAETWGCIEAAGGHGAASTRDRLLRAARGLAPLSAARIRTALNAATPGDAALISASCGNAHLIHRFRSLLAAIHDAPDEATALQVIAADVWRASDGCSVIIRSAPLARQVAEAGRPWPGEAALTESVLQGGGPIVRDGLTPEAAEPITIAGAVLGSLAVRWITGMRPPLARVRDVLRTAAIAAAPSLKAVNTASLSSTEIDPAAYPDDLLGRGMLAERVRDAIRRAALAPYPVLIEGESGSGKELVARAIHARSCRRTRKFCAVNCAALTDDLLEAELFGHARGAFTGAVGERTGLFEEADQGTIFLDEAADLSARGQAKLLRVLQEGEIRRIGENLPRKVDARIVAATNRSLEAEVGGGRFRADLRFRLDVIRIALPPLRERAEDVPWLAQRIWADAARRIGTRAMLGDELLAALARYDWPGNVRELQNVIASLAVHGPRRGRVPVSLLPTHLAQVADLPGSGFDQARLQFERRFVRAALARANGSRSSAAIELGVSRQGLAKIIKRLGL